MQEPGDGERRPSTLNHSVMVGAVGNFVECFDWFAYALFASYISRQVFPAGDPLAGLLSTFAIFAVGFFVRPVGSFIFGIYTDRHGRKNALAATIFLMAAGSLMIAVVPTFAQAGWLSPAMLIAARLLQGLAMGGETSAGGSYIVEASPARHRGFSGSFFYISVGLGTLSASLAGSLLTQLLTPAQMESVGWRLVFVLGAALGLFGLYMRRSAAESELFLQVAKTTRKKDRGSLRVVAAEYWPSMLRLFLVAIGPTMALYIWVGYVPNILRAKGLVSAATTFSASTLGLIVYTLCMPISGALSDRIGRRLVLGVSWLVFAALLAPMMRYVMADAGSLPWVTCAAMALIGLGSARSRPASPSSSRPGSGR